MARTEFAIETSASHLSGLASVCKGCAASLEENAVDADARLEILGGLWEPWAQLEPGQRLDLLELPAVGDAPLAPAPLAGYMHATALMQLEQLRQLSDDENLPQELLASLLAGRLLAAQYLADDFEADPKLEAATLPAGALLTNPEGAAVSPSNTSESELASQSGAQTSEDARQRAAQAMDCAGSTLGFTSLATEKVDWEQSLYDELISRRIQLEQLGPWPAPIRCVIQFEEPSDVLEAVLGADLQLLISGDTALEELGLRWLLQDVKSVAAVGGIVPVTPGLASGDAVDVETERDVIDGAEGDS